MPDQVTLTLRPSQLYALLIKAIPAGISVLIAGPPGSGKTQIWQAAARASAYDFVTSHPAVEDPTDGKGMPAQVDGGWDFLPFANLKHVLETRVPLVWGLEDIGQATPLVQASYMPWLGDRQLNGRRLPDNVTFVATTNRRGDRAGVQGLLEPVKSRFHMIVHLETTLEDWKTWASLNGVCPEPIAFLGLRPDLLHDFKPTGDIVNSPNPRGWERLSDVMKLDLTPDLELPAYAGSVGDACAGEFVAFLRDYRALGTIPQDVLADPEKAAIPNGASALYAVAAAVAYLATAANLKNIIRYAERLREKGHAEFAVLMIRDATKRAPKIQSTPTWTKFLLSELGKLITGRE